MAEPRRGVRHVNISPDDEGFRTQPCDSSSPPRPASCSGRERSTSSGRSPARSAGARSSSPAARQRARPRLASGSAAASVESVVFAVAGEPTIDDVRRGCALARQAEPELVVACGGGSAIDAGKAIAALVANGGDPLDYLEIVGRGRPLDRPSLPFVAIPTTAGTGSEVTRNAVLASPEHRAKASLRSPFLLARAAIVDPDLLTDLPPHVVAASGLDALTQLVEPFVSVRANALVDGLCREGIARSARSLRRAFAGDLSQAVRVDLALASLFGGLALANAGLGAVHGIAGPVGGMFDVAARRGMRGAPGRRRTRERTRPGESRAPEPGARALPRDRRHRDRSCKRRDRRSRHLARSAGGCAGRARSLALGRECGRYPRSRGEGTRREQHERQPDRPGRSGARSDRARLALAWSPAGLFGSPELSACP